MDSVLDLASTDPIIGPAENHFISPQFADWLKHDDEPEATEVRRNIKHGVQLKTPSHIGPITDSANSASREHDTCTTSSKVIAAVVIWVFFLTRVKKRLKCIILTIMKTQKCLTIPLKRDQHFGSKNSNGACYTPDGW